MNKNEIRVRHYSFDEWGGGGGIGTMPDDSPFYGEESEYYSAYTDALEEIFSEAERTGATLWSPDDFSTGWRCYASRIEYRPYSPRG